MGITVKEALKLPALRDARLVAGEACLENIIFSVNVMEVPDISRFVKAGELLVTTTYPIKDDKASQLNLIKNLAQQGVAALAIEPVYYENDIPAHMIDLADRLGFPLIQLAENTSFNEIINPIMKEILNRQAVVFQRNYEIHKNFVNLVLGGGSLAEIAHMIASIKETAVSIHTLQMKLLAYAEPDKETCEYQSLANDTPMLHKWLEGGLEKATVQSERGPITLIVHPVIVAGEKYAYIILWFSGTEQAEQAEQPYEFNLIEQISTVIALELTKLRAIAEVEQRFRNKIIDDLLQGKIKSRDDLLSRGESYGWDLSAGFVPIVLEAAGTHHDDTALTHNYMRILRKFMEMVNVAASYRCANAIVVDMHTHCLVLLPVTSAAAQKEMTDKATELGGQIRAKMAVYKDIRVSVGIGRYIGDIMLLEQGYEQAGQALEIGRMMKDSDGVTHFDDLGVYRILSIGRHNPEQEQFGKELLGGLIESDHTLRTDFIRTLDVVLRYYDNLREASRALFIHHNTLKYRVKKIEKMTGMSLKSAEARLNLQIALKIMRMNERR